MVYRATRGTAQSEVKVEKAWHVNLDSIAQNKHGHPRFTGSQGPTASP